MSAYCLQQVEALSRLVEIDFINFKSIYPPILYPIAQTEEDQVFQPRLNRNVSVDTRLRWYNPIGACRAGWTAKNDIVHFHWWTSFLFIVFFPLVLFAKLRGKKVVCTVHNVLGHESNAVDRWLCRTMLALPDRYIVHSEKNREKLAEIFGIEPARVSVIPHGRYDFYKQEPLSKKQARAHLGLPANSKVVLFFGHVRDYKGVDTLLRAMAQVRPKVPEARCLIAGKNWVSWRPYQEIIDEQDLQGTVDARLDYVPSSLVQYLYSAADVVVLPYKHFDSQSGPGNIALGFGRPLIVSNVGGLPDLVRERDVVFEPGDVDGLARALLRVLTDAAYRKKLARDSQQLAEQYSWDAIAHKTTEVYKSVLNGKA